MTHGSKCKSLHGHRGTIEVTCAGQALHSSGEQSQMVLDFGFLKEVMMDVIDASIDHGFVVSIEDHELLRHLIEHEPAKLEDTIASSLERKGYWLSSEEQSGKIKTLLGTKLYVVPFVPTSERLAEHFF